MKHSHKIFTIRLAALLVFMSSAVLLTGAGKIGPALFSRERQQNRNRMEIVNTLQKVLHGTLDPAVEKEASLDALARNNPMEMMQLLCSELHQTPPR